MTTFQINSTGQNTIDNVAGLLARFGLVIVIAWFGGMKFTNYEAQPTTRRRAFIRWCPKARS